MTMRRLFTLSRPCIALLFALVMACAGAPRTNSALPAPPDGPCELSAESLHVISQLDADFDRRIQAPAAEPESTDGYGYEFEDDPEPGGATVDDGSCDCLAQAVSGDPAPNCRRVLRAASVCIGGPGSRRLWAHRNCLPYRAATSATKITIDFALGGCIVPDSAFLRVGVDRTDLSKPF